MYSITQKASLMNKAQLSVENTGLQFFLLCALWVFHAFKPEWTIPGLRFIAPLQTLIQLFLLLLLFLYPGKKFENPLTKYFFLFLVLMILSSAFARNTGLPRDIIKGTSLLFITYLATITFANNEKRTFLLFNIFIFGNLLIAILGIKGGGLARGVAIFADENDLALNMNIFLPIVFFLGINEENKVKKIFYFILAGIFLAATVISFSRGGFVGLVAVLVFAWLKAPINKFRSTLVILIIILAMAYFAPQSFWDEMRTIEQGSQESTAAGRIYFWKVAVREFLDNPIIGVGVMNFGVWYPDYIKPDDTMSNEMAIPGHIRDWGRVCHSIYFTLLSELGSIGVILFMLMLYQFYKEIRFDKRLINSQFSLNGFQETDVAKKDQLIRNLQKFNSLGLGLMGGMIGFLASGVFLSVLYYPQFWLLCSLGATLGNCKKKIIEVAKINNYN